MDKRPDWRAVMSEGSAATVRAGHAIFRQGGIADAVYFVVSGRIKIFVVSRHGKEGVIRIASAGTFFGEGSLRGRDRHTATATALTDSEIVRLPVPAAWRALYGNPAFAELFASCLLARLERLEADVVDHLVNSSERRLARLLLTMTHGGEAGFEPIGRINQQTLARMIGTTRPRVSEFLNKFRRQGHIEYVNGHIAVRETLLSVVQGEPPGARVAAGNRPRAGA